MTSDKCVDPYANRNVQDASGRASVAPYNRRVCQI
jgi:hypothetical protein